MESLLSLAPSGIIGSLLGGLFRLIPAWFQYKEKVNDRAHELAMMDKQAELERGKFESERALAEANHQANIDNGLVSSLLAAIQQQTEMAAQLPQGSRVAALSASVRPVITYWLLAIYSVAHFVFFFAEWKDTDSVHAAFKLIMTPDFLALVSGTLNYWFLDRSLSKRGL